MGTLDRLSAFARVNGVAVVMCAAAFFLARAAFAQTVPEDEDVDLSGVADVVNLLRMVVDPSPSPVLSSPVERAVSGRVVPSNSASAGPRVVTVRPTVTLPDIVIPEEESDAPAVAAAETEPKESEPAAAKPIPSASGEDDDEGSDTRTPFYYVFFFGDYVPYHNGWFYYSDAWLWGRRGPRPPNPPGWIPPPPPPDGPFRPGPGARSERVIIRDGGTLRRIGGSRTAGSGSGTMEIVSPRLPGSIPVAPDAPRSPRGNSR